METNNIEWKKDPPFNSGNHLQELLNFAIEIGC